jgi:hypothetical protein
VVLRAEERGGALDPRRDHPRGEVGREAVAHRGVDRRLGEEADVGRQHAEDGRRGGHLRVGDLDDGGAAAQQPQQLLAQLGLGRRRRPPGLDGHGDDALAHARGRVGHEADHGAVGVRRAELCDGHAAEDRDDGEGPGGLLGGLVQLAGLVAQDDDVGAPGQRRGVRDGLSPQLGGERVGATRDGVEAERGLADPPREGGGHVARSEVSQAHERPRTVPGPTLRTPRPTGAGARTG